MLHFVLIDDVPDHHKVLSLRLEEAAKALNQSAQIDLMTTEPQAVLDYAASAVEPTVYFVDIELNRDMTGIELCRQIRAVCPAAYVVYVSAYQQYAFDCCRSHAFDFLLKPLMPEQLQDCLASIVRDIRYREEGTKLEIRLGTKLVLLQQEDILYFCKDHANLNAVCRQGNTVVWRESFSTLLPRLDAVLFLQCHKGYIVNRRHIRELCWAEGKLILTNGEALPISRRKAQWLREETMKGGLKA